MTNENLITQPKTEIDQIFETFGRMRCEALFYEERLKLGRGEYKWEIGIGIYEKVKKLSALQHEEDEAPTLMGWPVEINYKNSTCIKLWRDIN